MYIPELLVKKVDFNENIMYINNLLSKEFLSFNKSLPFADKVFGLIPELKTRITESLTDEERYNIIHSVVMERLNRNSDEIDKQVMNLQNKFNMFYNPFLERLLELFNLEWDKCQPQIICYLGCYPVFPRSVMTKEFYINYNTVDERIFTGSLHEINHFVLFEKWKSMHGYTKTVEPVYPEPLWYLEEIAVDPTLNEACLMEIAPYPQKAYQQFYKADREGISIMDRIKKIYNERSSIEEFLDKAYEFIAENIDVINK